MNGATRGKGGGVETGPEADGKPRLFARHEFNGNVCARRLLAAQPEIPFHRGFRDTGVKPGKIPCRGSTIREGKGDGDVRGRW